MGEGRAGRGVGVQAEMGTEGTLLTILLEAISAERE